MKRSSSWVIVGLLALLFWSHREQFGSLQVRQAAAIQSEPERSAKPKINPALAFLSKEIEKPATSTATEALVTDLAERSWKIWTYDLGREESIKQNLPLVVYVSKPFPTPIPNAITSEAKEHDGCKKGSALVCYPANGKLWSESWGYIENGGYIGIVSAVEKANQKIKAK